MFFCTTHCGKRPLTVCPSGTHPSGWTVHIDKKVSEAARHALLEIVYALQKKYALEHG
jgi:hypothetical protein